MSHAKRATKDNTKNSEYHVVAAIRKLQSPVNEWNDEFVFSNDTGILGKNPITPRLLFWELCEDHFSFYLMSAVHIWFISYTLFTFISSFTGTYMNLQLTSSQHQWLRSSVAGKASYRHREVTAGTNPVEVLNFFSGFFPYYCVHNCEDHFISFPL